MAPPHVRVYCVVSVVLHGVLVAPFSRGVYYLGRVPAVVGGGIWLCPPHGDLVPSPERVGVWWGGGRVSLLDPS
eukprot:scaffold63704_cov55-Phaeocystis_antarctica.AAC.1